MIHKNHRKKWHFRYDKFRDKGPFFGRTRFGSKSERVSSEIVRFLQFRVEILEFLGFRVFRGLAADFLH